MKLDSEVCYNGTKYRKIFKGNGFFSRRTSLFSNEIPLLIEVCCRFSLHVLCTVVGQNSQPHWLKLVNREIFQVSKKLHGDFLHQKRFEDFGRCCFNYSTVIKKTGYVPLPNPVTLWNLRHPFIQKILKNGSKKAWLQNIKCMQTYFLEKLIYLLCPIQKPSS